MVAGLNEQGSQALFIQGDLASKGVCEAIVAQTLERFGKVNYLVNNAFSFVAKGLDATRGKIGNASFLSVRWPMPTWPHVTSRP